jgi:hypothetical protein
MRCMPVGASVRLTVTELQAFFRYEFDRDPITIRLDLIDRVRGFRQLRDFACAHAEAQPILDGRRGAPRPSDRAPTGVSAGR